VKPPVGLTIKGFSGQTMKIVGQPNTVYNMISSELVQYNTKMIYIPSMNSMQIGELSVQFKSSASSTQIKTLQLTAGTETQRMSIKVNGVAKSAFTKQTIQFDAFNTLQIYTSGTVLLETRDYTFTLSNNRAVYLNQQVAQKTALTNKIKAFNAATPITTMPHGILGQTWRKISYPNEWIYLEGTLSQYVIQTGLLTKPTGAFNRF
jgi:hypothetical protein